MDVTRTGICTHRINLMHQTSIVKGIITNCKTTADLGNNLSFCLSTLPGGVALHWLRSRLVPAFPFSPLAPACGLFSNCRSNCLLSIFTLDANVTLETIVGDSVLGFGVLQQRIWCDLCSFASGQCLVKVIKSKSRPSCFPQGLQGNSRTVKV